MLMVPELAELPGVDADVVVFGDHEDPHVVYVLPRAPRLVALELLTYRGDPSSGFPELGALLSVDVDLGVPPTVLDRVLTRLGDVRPREPDWVDGTAVLTVPVIGGGGALPGRLALRGGCPAHFATRLDAASATLLVQELRAGHSPFQVAYQLRAAARLRTGRMRIFARAEPLADRWAEVSAAAPGPDRRRALEAVQAAGVEVLDWPVGGDEALRRQLGDWGWELLEHTVAGLGTQDPGPPVFADHDFVVESGASVPWPVPVAGAVAGFDPQRHLAGLVELDLSDPIHRILEVHVRCNAPFDDDALAAVTVELCYGERKESFVFTRPGDVQIFRAVMDPADGDTYTYRATARFRASSRSVVAHEGPSTDRQLLVALDRLGRFHVGVTGFALDWSDLAEVDVGIRYGDPDNGVEPRDDVVRLTAAAPTARYERRFPAASTGRYEFRVVHVGTDGRRTERDWAPSEAALLVLEDPHPAELAVELVAAGLAGITSHVVEVVHGGVLRVATLDRTHLRETVRFGLADGAGPDFRWRATTSFADGHHEVGGWADGTGSQRIRVGPVPVQMLEVTLVGDLVDHDAVRFVRLDVRHGAHFLASHVFTRRSPASVTVTIPVLAGAEPEYTVTTTVVAADGAQTVGPPAVSSDPTFVIPPHGI